MPTESVSDFLVDLDTESAMPTESVSDKDLKNANPCGVDKYAALLDPDPSLVPSK